MWKLRNILPLFFLRRHTLVVAKSGSGKSELLKLLVLLLKSPLFPWERRRVNARTVIVLDPHGDLVRETARQKAWHRSLKRSAQRGKPPRLVVISPNLQRGWMPSLNPFDLKGKRLSFAGLQVLAQHLTSAFGSILGRGSVALSAHMRTVLVPIFTVLLVMAKEGNRAITFHDLERFLDDTRNSDLMAFAQRRIDHPALRSFFLNLYAEPRLRATKFALQTRMASLLNLQAFTNLFCHPTSTWDLSRLMNSGKTILIDADTSRLGSLVSELFGRTVVALVQGYAFARSRQHRKCPVFFLIDEASTFTSPDLATMLTQTRKFGVHLLLVNQVVGQGGMGKEWNDTLMGNTAVKIIGSAGATSRRAMASEFECSPDALRGFKVGEFAVKLDNGFPPRKILLPDGWIGDRFTLSDRHWERLIPHQLHYFYRRLPPSRQGHSPASHASPPIVPESHSQNSSPLFHPRPTHS